MKKKLKPSEITFQPFLLFTKVLEELFAGYCIRKPKDFIIENYEQRLNRYRPCNQISLNPMTKMDLSSIVYAISKDMFLTLKAGNTYIEIQLNEDGLINIWLFCIETANNQVNPDTLIDPFRMKTSIKKLEDPVFIDTMKEFMGNQFTDPSILRKWIITKCLPLLP